MNNKHICCSLLLLVLSFSTLSLGSLSQSVAENMSVATNMTQTDENGTFNFSHLAAGTYNLAAHRLILGAMHYMGDATVIVPGNGSNVTITIKKTDEAHYVSFQNTTVDLQPGNYSINGLVIGPNRPGAEPSEIPYEDTQVKIIGSD